MKPYYDDGKGIVIFHGDCREILPTVESVRLVVTDPPYVFGIASTAQEGKAGGWEPRIETVNDLDCMVANFWRATQADPDAVARWADWPVNEADLHARHRWLVEQLPAHRERMKTEPDYCDAKIAGWWVWGLCQWIGTGWCVDRRASGDGQRGQGDLPPSLSRQLPHLGNGGMGINRTPQQIPHLGDAGRGIHRKIPHLGDAGRGIHRKIPHLGDAGRDLSPLFSELASRLRGVRIACGDWSRVLGDSVTWRHGVTGILLDPPYRDGDMEYAAQTEDVSAAVGRWAREHEGHPLLRIAVCGLDGEHDLPGWECVPWKARGGYGSQRADGSNDNRKRERIWFSPACLRPDKGQLALLGGAA